MQCYTWDSEITQKSRWHSRTTPEKIHYDIAPLRVQQTKLLKALIDINSNLQHIPYNDNKIVRNWDSNGPYLITESSTLQNFSTLSKNLKFRNKGTHKYNLRSS